MWHVSFLNCRLELERQLQEYETEQQVNAQYVEEFAMLTSEKVSFDDCVNLQLYLLHFVWIACF